MTSPILTPQGVRLFTIGHSNVTSDTILTLLKSSGVQRLVDIRSKPFSRWVSQFNREPFAAFLKQHGIEYVFEGASLGGYPEDASVYPGGVARFGEAVNYQAIMRKDWYQRCIDRLISLAAEMPTAIMCAEEDPADCHRQMLVSQTLLERGVQVLHIRHDGSLQPAWRNESLV